MKHYIKFSLILLISIVLVGCSEHVLVNDYKYIILQSLVGSTDDSRNMKVILQKETAETSALEIEGRATPNGLVYVNPDNIFISTYDGVYNIVNNEYKISKFNSDIPAQQMLTNSAGALADTNTFYFLYNGYVNEESLTIGKIRFGNDENLFTEDIIFGFLPKSIGSDAKKCFIFLCYPEISLGMSISFNSFVILVYPIL